MLLSAATLIAVFLRRLYIYKTGGEKKVEEVGENMEETFKTRPLKMEKGDKQKIEALFAKGESLLNLGKDDEAIKCFVQILAVDEHHEATLHKLAMLYLQKQMFSGASALFKQLCEGEPDAVHYSHLGYALYQQSDFEAAKKAYQEAIKLDSARPQRFVSLSQVYRSLGMINNAVIALNKALEVEEDNADFLFLMAGLKSDQGDNVAAASMLEKIIAADPQHLEAQELLKSLRSTVQE